MKLFKLRANEEEKIEEKAEEKNVEESILEAMTEDDNVTFEMAMKIPAFSACINLIETTISMIPIKLYQRTGGAVTEAKEDTRVKLLNQDTGDTLDAVQFKRAMVRDYFGKGGYAFINRNGTKTESIHYVDSREISIQQNTDPIFKQYVLMVQGTQYEPYQFLKLLRVTQNGMSSTSLVEENKDILATAYNSLKYEKGIAKTGGNKKGVLQSDRELDEGAMRRLKSAWRKLYRNNAENIVVLNKGLEFKETSNSAVEMQMNENKKTNSDEICKIFNMPPEMIRGGAKESDKILFIQYCINPLLNEWECALNRDMLLETEKESYFFAADTSELTKGDLKARYEAYAIGCKNGFLQPDEARFRENMPPLGLDFIKFGLQDVMYDTKTKQFYIPNMNDSGELNGNQTGSEKEEKKEDEN